MYTYDSTIRNYEMELNPFLYMMYVTGKMEVVTPLEIPSQTLFFNLHLPNQLIKDVELVPNRWEQCHSEYGRCSVFRFKTFFSLSGDKYFSRDFREYEKIPLKMLFELKDENWSLLKNLNGLRDQHDFKYINFVNKLKNLEINGHFNYKNSFTVERAKYENPFSGKWIDVPYRWKINKYSSEIETWRLYITIKKLDFLNEPIDELFSLSASSRDLEDLEVEAKETILTIPNRQGITLAPPSRIKKNNKLVFKVSEGVTRTANGTYAPDPLNDKIFIHEKSRGLISNRLLMKARNNSFYLNINNQYSFAEERNPDIPKNSRIRVFSKNDEHFRRLNKFNFIDF